MEVLEECFSERTYTATVKLLVYGTIATDLLGLIMIIFTLMAAIFGFLKLESNRTIVTILSISMIG